MAELATIDSLRRRYGHLEAKPLLEAMIQREFSGRIAVISSFGAESAVLLDLVAEVDKAVPVIFLDTGELFDETLDYRLDLERHLGLTNIQVVRPLPEDLAAAAELWLTDHDRCCALRKVKPLERAASPFAALIDGRKRAHGFEREAISTFEEADGVVKVSPLAQWSAEEIEAAFVARKLPRHPLLSQNYRSIGCWPCTRPVAEGEPARAGRWAGSAKTECGIHKAPGPQSLKG
jgi:phosphoadenosine phosphosulfate reductase